MIEWLEFFAIPIAVIGLIGIVPMILAASTGKRLGHFEVSWRRAVALTVVRSLAIPITILLFGGLAIWGNVIGMPLKGEGPMWFVLLVAGIPAAIWTPLVALAFVSGRKVGKREFDLAQLQTQSLKEGKS